VSNPGNVTLNNVTVVNAQASPTTVLTVPSLAPGASVNFTASFAAPADACAVSTTVTASGSDNCTSVAVTATKSATCALVTTPRLVITQDCPTGAVAPGGLLTYTGTVRNTGDITVTNVVVLNSRGGTTPVFTAAALAPGASASFTGSFTAPADVCSITSSSTVSGASTCGIPVTASVSSTCTILTSPLIAVTTVCATNVVAPGGAVGYSGTVRNTGNVTLKNVTVVSDRPAANTTVFTVATLAPGASANFTGSYTAPASFPPGSCGVTATVVATGLDLCTDAAVTATAAANCTITTTPLIAVTLNCPVTPVATGALITYTGTVSNPGNVTLNNVTVVNAQASPTTVLTVPSLAPGASVNFTASFTTPVNVCDVSTTVTASGSDNCTSVVVTATKSTTCPLVTAPQIAITQECPTEPAVPGGNATFTGTVRNTGNITLNNVIVSRNQAGVVPEVPSPTTVGLVGYWALNEAAGSTAQDGSGTGNIGTLNNAVRVAGAVGNAVRFNGVNSSVIIPNNAGLDITGQITLAAWIKPESLTGKQNILAHGYTLTPARSVYLRINDGHYEIGSQQDTTQPIASAAVPAGDLGSFVHVAGVYNGSAWIIYRNGVALNTFASPVGAVAVNAGWAIGARDAGTDRYFQGVIDEARIYNRALSAAEILVLAGLPTVPPVDPGVSTPVFTVASLAPGASASFTVSYPVAPEGCSITSTLFAAGGDLCTGTRVTANVTTTCELLTAPAIEVTQFCPTTPVLQGGLLTYTGTVRNVGNITLTNVIVVSDQPAAGTVIFTVASLAPGASANFTGSYQVPVNCCVVSSSVRASGRDCAGITVADTATRTCTVLTTPQLAVTKVCAPREEPLRPGDLLTYTGTVRNTGNITLVNVTVKNNWSPILGPLILAPGESFDYTTSYIVPDDFCGMDTVTATGLDVCTLQPIADSVTVTCPVTPISRIVVTKNCPASPTPHLGLLIFTGTVSNPGKVTLVNVFVVNNQPSNNTPVIGPITLAPGASVNFTGSYTAPEYCCQVIDTLTARGQDRCTGTEVTATATAVCPLLNTPLITVTKDCPTTPVPVGGLYAFSGSVSNAGDTILTNVYVVSSQPNPNTPLLGPIELAPGETKAFSGSYTVTAGSDPATATVTARGMDTCQGATTTATADCFGPVGSTITASVSIADGQATVSWTATAGTAYALQIRAGTSDPWVSLPGNVTATSTTASKQDAIGTNQQRFYRVIVVQ
jgi:uncharacterized repeat protein (TIGR01451 family)